MRAAFALVLSLLMTPWVVAQEPSLDYEFFKTRVQPIFLAKRTGHARCVACHVSGTPLRLQPLAPGSANWNEEDTRKNFEAVRRMVVPGSAKSRLLIHPLAEEAGGDFFHNGGKHWASQNDPEWQTFLSKAQPLLQQQEAVVLIPTGPSPMK